MRSALAALVMLAATAALAEPPAKPQAAEAKSLPANPGSCGGGAWRNPSYKPPTRDVLAKQLPANSYNVTQQEGTESPFHNAYWDNHAPGIYVDVVSGEPLFSSTDKFDSGTGWPSFTRPLAADHVTNKTDGSLFMTRTEVRSKEAGSHLGHVFDDGPQPTGLRYCINSAALRFIPATELAKAGYPEYVKLFPKATASK